MKLKYRRIIELVLLVVFGFVIGINFSGKENKPIVIYKNNPDTSKSEFVHASFEQKELSGMASFNESFVNIAETVSPAVVTITTTKVIENRNQFAEDEFFQRFFGLPKNGGTHQSIALGSGVIINEKGYILTNNHVVENGEEIKVELADKREYNAEIIGTDPRTDIAVIKIDAKDLPFAILGSSEKLRVGEWVAAIGSPLRQDLAHTITAGIVSAKGRNINIGNSFGSFIQTDAAINPGNSGGALVNMKGELIGINSAIATDGGRGNIGIGFAIPIDLAKKIMHDLIENGNVKRAWVGITLQEVNDEVAKANEMDKIKGALVNSIVKDSPGEKNGIEIGDIILKVDEDDVKDVGHLQYLIASKDIGHKVKLGILREGKNIIIKLKLEQMPDESQKVVKAIQEDNNIEKYGIKISDISPVLINRFELDKNESGIIVTAIERGSEFKVGDIIKRIDNKKVNSVSEFQNKLEKIKKEYFMVLVKRRGNTFFLILETKK